MGGFIREKKIQCGEQYQIVEIFPYSDERERGAKKSGRVRVAETCPAQKRLNDRRAQMYLEQLIFANFVKGDYYISLSYSDKYVPKSDEDADHQFAAFMRRVKYREKKRGFEIGRYINVVESTDVTGKPVRYHHHLLLSTQLSEAEVRACWKKRGDEGGIGFVDISVIEPEEGAGIIRLAEYLTKNAEGADNPRPCGTPPSQKGAARSAGVVVGADAPYPVPEHVQSNTTGEARLHRGRRPNRKRWSASRNLVKPFATRNDSRYSARQFERLAERTPVDAEYWERQYPGFRLLAPPNGFEARKNPETGEYGIRLRLMRRGGGTRVKMGYTPALHGQKGRKV
jgi:hypothetical protein